jgi:hypothetical protein
MTHSNISRRSVTTGLAAAVTAIPAVGLCVLSFEATAKSKPLVMVVAQTV